MGFDIAFCICCTAYRLKVPSSVHACVPTNVCRLHICMYYFCAQMRCLESFELKRPCFCWRGWRASSFATVLCVCCTNLPIILLSGAVIGPSSILTFEAADKSRRHVTLPIIHRTNLFRVLRHTPIKPPPHLLHNYQAPIAIFLDVLCWSLQMNMKLKQPKKAFAAFSESFQYHVGSSSVTANIIAELEPMWWP